MEFLFNLPTGDIAYDIETYPNVFTFRCRHVDLDRRWAFEISPRRNDIVLMVQFINYCRINGNRWVGFNNIGFDYPVVHFIAQNQNALITYKDIYDKAMSIINAQHNARFTHMVWESDWLVPQIDLFKIHHFDNVARATSLKVLEFNMRMNNIEDLPFDVGTELTSDQIDVLCKYNDHDVDATVDFYHETKEQIQFREELTNKYDKNFINHNDTKIGKDYFIMELEKVAPGCCYNYSNGRRQMVQTIRDKIDLSDVILPCVSFSDPEFNRILDWFKSQVITETKGVFKDISCNVNGFNFDFGTGGIHGSIESSIVSSDEEFIIIDLDVASYYPNLAIANKFYPAHLGSTFYKVYSDVYEMRKAHPKKEFPAINAMLKLALNGVYGDSNNKYSPFYDPQYTMSITINGQLLLCMLAEALMNSPDVQMIQINTDGLTIRCPRSLKPWIEQVQSWWENLTNLELEAAEYSRMFIRDVNNYIAEYTSGDLKRKGAYEYELGWHQNHSAIIVPKAAEAALVHGADIRSFIAGHDDIFDFFLRAKVPRSTRLEWGGEQVSNIVRYFISTEGRPLEKVMPPAGPEGAFKRKNGISDFQYQTVLEEVGDVWDERIHTKNKSVYEERRTGINTGWSVELCNNLEGVTFDTLNHEWYIKQAEKLVTLLTEEE
jgi:hypothetical protein